MYNFYNSVTYKPEDGWSENPKYCYKYNSMFQPQLTLTYYRFTFQVWLINRDPTFNQVGSSFMALQYLALKFFLFLSRVVHFQPTSSEV